MRCFLGQKLTAKFQETVMLDFRFGLFSSFVCYSKLLSTCCAGGTAARERLGCPHRVYTSDKTDKHTGMMNAAKERWTMLLLVGGLVAGETGPKSGKNEWPLTRLMKEGRMF